MYTIVEFTVENKSMKLYIVTAYRWGNKESHNYVIGVFDNKDVASQQAKYEEERRSGKYTCEIIETEVNVYKQYQIIKSL